MSQTTTAELSDEELVAFTALLDEIIPPHAQRGLPGAGETGLAGEIDEQVPELRPTLHQGLAALEEKARARGAARFSELAQPDRVAALNELVDDEPVKIVIDVPVITSMSLLLSGSRNSPLD